MNGRFEVEVFQNNAQSNTARGARPGGFRGCAGRRTGYDRQPRRSRAALEIAWFPPRSPSSPATEGLLISRSRATVSLACNCRYPVSRLDDVGEWSRRRRRPSAPPSGRPLGLPAQIARRIQADMTGRGRKKHESHHVSAGFAAAPTVERLARGQAANF